MSELNPARFTQSMDGGVVGNQALHHLDLMVLFAGPVKSVFARGASFLVSIESYESVSASFMFDSGALGTFTATNAARPRNVGASITVIGSKGVAKIGGTAVNEILDWTHNASKGIGLEQQKIDSISGFGHAGFYEAVYKARIQSGLDVAENSPWSFRTDE